MGSSIVEIVERLKDSSEEEYALHVMNEKNKLDGLSKQIFSNFNSEDLDTQEGRKKFQKEAATFGNILYEQIPPSVFDGINSGYAVRVYSFWVDVAEQATKKANLEVGFSLFVVLQNKYLYRIFNQGEHGYPLLSDTTKSKKQFLEEIFNPYHNYAAVRKYQKLLQDSCKEFFGPLIVLSKDIEHLNVICSDKKISKRAEWCIVSTFKSFLLQAKKIQMIEDCDSIEGEKVEKDVHHLSSKLKQFLSIKQALEFRRTDLKNSAVSLRELCDWCSRHDAKDKILVNLLNLSEHALLRWEICPNGEKVRMRDIRHYACFGVKSVSGYFFNVQDKANKAFFSFSRSF